MARWKVSVVCWLFGWCMLIPLFVSEVRAQFQIKVLKTSKDQILVVKIDAKSRLVRPGKKPLVKAKEMRAFFRAEIKKLKSKAKKGKFNPLLSLHPHGDTVYKDLLRILEIAKEAGFQNWRIYLNASQTKGSKLSR